MFSDFINLMFSATLVTLGLAVCSLILGLILAIIFVVLETSKVRCISRPTSIIVTLLRGLPEILVVLLIFFGSTQVLFLFWVK